MSGARVGSRRALESARSAAAAVVALATAPPPDRYAPARPIPRPRSRWRRGGGVGGVGPGRRTAADTGPNATAGCPGTGPAATPTAAPSRAAAPGRPGTGAATGRREERGRPSREVGTARPGPGPGAARATVPRPAATAADALAGQRPDPAVNGRPGPLRVGIGGARPAAASAAPAPWPESARTDPRPGRLRDHPHRQGRPDRPARAPVLPRRRPGPDPDVGAGVGAVREPRARWGRVGNRDGVLARHRRASGRSRRPGHRSTRRS
jgi:hypothetical protein